jgi:hypothetical protein
VQTGHACEAGVDKTNAELSLAITVQRKYRVSSALHDNAIVGLRSKQCLFCPPLGGDVEHRTDYA